MMHKKTIFSGLVLTALSFSSCSEYSLMDDEAIRMGLFGEEYSENFENAYGKIAPDQTWDFSSYNLRKLGLLGGPTTGNASTRTAKTTSWNSSAPCHGAITGATFGNSDIVKTVDSWYNVPSTTQTWMDTNLTEGQPHRDLGENFKLVKPENNKDFLLIPIYQGHSGMTWDLHLVAENNSSALKDYKIWSHSENIRYTNATDDLVEFYYNTADVTGTPEGLEESGGDIYEWAAGGVVKGIHLYRAFQDLTVVNNSTIYLDVPAGGYVKAYITNRYDQGDYDSRWRIEADNSSEAGTQRFRFDLTNIGSQSWFPDNLWNLVLVVDYYSNCTFDTFDSKRVRIYTNHHTNTVTLTDTNCGSSTQNFINRHTIDRKNVQAKPIRIDCSKIKDDFYFYLDVTRGDEYVTGDNDQAATGTRQRSDKGMMLALKDNGTLINSSELTTAVNNIITDYGSISTCEYFVIGCEDANLSSSDWDINDVVFLVVGLDKAPKIKEIISKRYMIEDLGSTFDFDFNDIVVDVTQEGLKKVGDVSYSTVKQTAEIKWLCGTIPFQLKIGDTTFDKLEGHVSTYPHEVYQIEKYKKTITGWDPSGNNITVTTWPKAAGWTDDGKSGFLGDKDSQSFKFPEAGEFPYIIACDQDVMWMDEMVSVPKAWFKTWPQAYYDYTHQTPDSDTPVIETLYSNNEGYALDWTKDGNFVKLDKSKMTSLKAGDVVKVYATNIESGAKWQLKAYWESVIGEESVAVSATESTLTLTSDMITALNKALSEHSDDENVFALQGMNFTVTKVELIKK